MSEITRPKRSRSTDAVLSNLDAPRTWWQDTPDYKPRSKYLRFRSGDSFDRLSIVRYFVIAISVVAPAAILLNSNLAPGVVHYDWHSDPMAEVHRCLADGRERKAVSALKAELSAYPDDPRLLRALAMLAADTMPAEARRAFNRLTTIGQATHEDAAGHAALLASLHDFTGAKAILSSLPKEAQMMPQALFAWLAVWREAGDFTAAASTLAQLLTTTPGEAVLAIDLLRRAAETGAAADALHSIESSVVSSLSHLMSSGKERDVLGIAPQLTNLPVSSPSNRLQISRILRNLPGQRVEHRLAAARFAHQAHIGTADEALLRADYQKEIFLSGGLTAEEKNHVADYLQRQDEHSFVTYFISEREALSEPTLFVRRFESLLEQGLWRDAGALVGDAEAPPLPQSRTLSQTLATLQRRQSRQHDVELLLSDTIEATRRENRALDCYATGVAALDHHLPTLAARAFAAALDVSRDRSKTMRSILRTSRQGRLPLDTFLRSLIGSPAMQDESIQEELIYFSLLTDQKVESMLAIVRNRQQASPGNVYLRFLEALALHKTGNHLDAAKLLIPLPQYRWHQGEAAVIASIIATAGQIERTTALIQQIDPAQLFEEERTLFSPWQTRLQAGQLISSIGSE